MRHIGYFVAAAIALPAAAGAEVRSATPNGFEIVSSAIAPVKPMDAYLALGKIGAWWNKEHTYSGSALNLSLDLKAGGCLCEKIPGDGGSVEHLRVVYARPGTELRLRGALGPLQREGIDGTLSWTFKPVEGGTEIILSYVVGGYIRSGAVQFAPMADGMLTEQLGNLVHYLSDQGHK